jgi:two-component system response regulator HydG
MASNVATPSLLTLADPAVADVIGQAASSAGIEVVATRSLRGLLEKLTERAWTATLVSLAAEHVDERTALRVSEEANSGALILTAPAVSLERALLMERAGAVALLREPVDPEQLHARLAMLLDEGPEVGVPDLPETDGRRGEPVLVGDSPAMGEVFETIARVARSPATVLVTGESGTGKEVVARALHWAGDRRSGPFVAVNCAAIPEHLLESELFGHERGAFTGAVARRVGRFERAHAGTLFLDEIGDMSLVLQAKVLRALEERVVERVGGDDDITVDVRVVAATNQELSSAMADGRFREDLYYRLAVVEIDLPPLRERRGDVRLLALHFAAYFARRYDKPLAAITRRALQRLETAPWPGNVRELRNVMDRGVLLAQGPTIRTGDLRIGAASPTGSAHAGRSGAAGYAATTSLQEVESDHIRRVLLSLDGHMARASTTLGIHRNTLARKMKEYGIEPPAAPRATP